MGLVGQPVLLESGDPRVREVGGNAVPIRRIDHHVAGHFVQRMIRAAGIDPTRVGDQRDTEVLLESKEAGAKGRRGRDVLINASSIVIPSCAAPFGIEPAIQLEGSNLDSGLVEILLYAV